MANKLEGPRYATAARAWKGGVMLTPVVANRLPIPDSSGDGEHHLKLRFTSLGVNVEYLFVPQCAGKVPNCEVLYYTAWNKTFQRNEFSISPDKLDLFVEEVERFVSIAGFYYMTATSEWQVKAGQFAYFGDLDALKDAWVGALTDPAYILQLLSPLAARGMGPKPGTGAPPIKKSVPAPQIKKAPPPPPPKGGGLHEGKSHFPRSKGIQQGQNISSPTSAGGAPNAKPLPPPVPAAAGGSTSAQAIKAMRSARTVPGNQMREFLKGNLRDSTCLQRLCNARKLTGAAKHAELLQSLDDLTAHTGIPVEKVPKGTVQKLRGKGDTASFRSKKGVFQIEEQLFDDTAALEEALAHDIPAYYGNNDMWHSPRLARGGPFNAGELLEFTVKNGGTFPNAVEAMLGQ